MGTAEGRNFIFSRTTYLFIKLIVVLRNECGNKEDEGEGGHAVALLVEALHYKLEGHRLNSQWCHWNFSLT
jgi:hypothetical protein